MGDHRGAEVRLKASMILAEAATMHLGDGTMSMLRAGIAYVWGEKPPVGLTGALVVRIESEYGDAGQHQFDLRLMDDDGAEDMPQIQGQFVVAKGGVVIILIMFFSSGFKKFGRFNFVLRVVNVKLVTYSINVAQRKPPQEKEK